MCFLQNHGYWAETDSGLQQKVAAFESGIGTWGKGGFILHPELGNRIALGTILTDAELEPDEKRELRFCENCQVCHNVCPAGAFGPEDQYHGNWDRQVCTAKRKEIDDSGEYCHNCFAACPSCGLADDFLFVKKTGRSIWNRR